MQRSRAAARLRGVTPRRACLLALLLALAGCGFEPLYGSRGPGGEAVRDDLAAVKIDLIANRSGQILRNYLLGMMTPRGEPPRPGYRLQIVLQEPRPQDLGIASDDSVVRYNFGIRARYRLYDAAGRQMLVEGLSDSSSSYTVTNSEYGTVAARDNARDRVLEEIAGDIRIQLGTYFRGQRAAAPQ